MTDTFLGTGDRVMNKLGKYIILNIYIIVKGYNMKLNSTTKSKEQKECIKIKIVWEAATEKQYMGGRTEKASLDGMVVPREE